MDLNSTPKLTMNGIDLPYCFKVKNLWLTMNNILSWTDHVNDTCNKGFYWHTRPEKGERLIAVSY